MRELRGMTPGLFMRTRLMETSPHPRRCAAKNHLGEFGRRCLLCATRYTPTGSDRGISPCSGCRTVRWRPLPRTVPSASTPACNCRRCQQHTLSALGADLSVLTPRLSELTATRQAHLSSMPMHNSRPCHDFCLRSGALSREIPRNLDKSRQCTVHLFRQ